MTRSTDNYIIVHPTKPVPTGLVTICHESKLDKIRCIESERKRRRYIVRGIVSDHIPLAGGIEEIMTAPVNRLIPIRENPLTMYLHYGGSNAVYYDLWPNDDGFLSHVDVEIETDLPSNTFSPARTALNDLMDAIVNVVWIPVVISRLDLYLKGEDEPLLHQLLLTFRDRLELGPIGGIHCFPLFSAHEALVREAITSTSPFYRFLCAHRLYDGIGPLRKKIKELCKRFSVTEKLPSDPTVDVKILSELGFKDDFIKGIKTVNDLRGKLTEMRNRIAHFLTKSDSVPVNTSDGFNYYEYALGGAVLLQYSHEALVELKKFYSTYLRPRMQRGEILPMKEYGDMFIIKI